MNIKLAARLIAVAKQILADEGAGRDAESYLRERTEQQRGAPTVPAGKKRTALKPQRPYSLSVDVGPVNVQEYVEKFQEAGLAVDEAGTETVYVNIDATDATDAILKVMTALVEAHGPRALGIRGSDFKAVGSSRTPTASTYGQQPDGTPWRKYNDDPTNGPYEPNSYKQLLRDAQKMLDGGTSAEVVQRWITLWCTDKGWELPSGGK